MGQLRDEIFKAIDSERNYGLYRWGVEDDDGVIREVPRSLAEFTNHIRTYLNRASELATTETSSAPVLHALRSVAALCVAAFEQHGCPPRPGSPVVNCRTQRVYDSVTGKPVLPKKKKAPEKP